MTDTTNATDVMRPNFRVEIWHDYDVESPNEYDAFKFVSFGSRHVNYEHPDTYMILVCEMCSGSGFGVEGQGWDDDCPTCEGAGEVECNPKDHPDVLATLSYYEHGLCKWMVGGSTVPDPYGGFDTVNVAGVVVKGDSFDQAWWDGETADRQRELLDGAAEVYTEWSNGECYGFTIEGVTYCDHCGAKGTEGMEAYGGYIGTKALAQGLGEYLAGDSIAINDYEISGEFGYVLDHDLDTIIEVYEGVVEYRKTGKVPA